MRFRKNGLLHRHGVIRWLKRHGWIQCLWCWAYGTECMDGVFGQCPLER